MGLHWAALVPRRQSRQLWTGQLSEGVCSRAKQGCILTWAVKPWAPAGHFISEAGSRRRHSEDMKGRRSRRTFQKPRGTWVTEGRRL